MITLPRSLRGRLTLAFAGVAVLGVGAFGWALSIMVEHAVWDPLDAGLTEEAETLATLVDLPPDRLTEAVRRIGGEHDLGPGKFVSVMTTNGRTLAAFGDVPVPAAARRPPPGDALRLMTLGEAPEVHRVAWTSGAAGTVVVLGVEARAQATLVRRARAAIAITAAALVLLLTALAWAVTSRATADLTRLATELETIAAGSLDRRLAARATTEVNRVVGVLNRMLERLESAVTHLKRFTADASHELRTPVAALRAHLEASLARSATPEDARAGLVDALEQTERLQRLSEDLLTLSAVESDVPGGDRREELVRLDALVREVAHSLRPIAEEQHRPFHLHASTPVTVAGSPSLLKRILLNLIDNAFRHTPAGTSVRVTLRTRDAVASLEVEDRGPGMSPVDLATVFDRFRKSSATGGSGLGLALVREIANRYGGRVTLARNPGGGMTAVVLLPLAPAERSG